jgi:hypothetical protein
MLSSPTSGGNNSGVGAGWEGNRQGRRPAGASAAFTGLPIVETKFERRAMLAPLHQSQTQGLFGELCF